MFVGGPIDDNMANLVVAQMLFLSNEDSKADIHMYINSPGGSVSAGMAIYDTMQYVRCDVATYSIGLSASMGSVLLAGGAAGKRYALPNARILLHQPLIGGVMQATATDLSIEAREIIRLRHRLYEIFSHHTGQELPKIEKDFDRNLWLDAERIAGVRSDRQGYGEHAADQERRQAVDRISVMNDQPASPKRWYPEGRALLGGLLAAVMLAGGCVAPTGKPAIAKAQDRITALETQVNELESAYRESAGYDRESAPADYKSGETGWQPPGGAPGAAGRHTVRQSQRGVQPVRQRQRQGHHALCSAVRCGRRFDQGGW